MPAHILTDSSDLAAYDAWVRAHPQGSLWQSPAWKQYQETLGREVRVYADEDGGRRTEDFGQRANTQSPMSNVLGPRSFSATALVVIDRTALGLSTWEIPRGPIAYDVHGMSYVVSLLDAIVRDAINANCCNLFLSPHSYDIPHTTYDIRTSSRSVFPSATRVIDLTQDAESLLTQMHPKGRYNIRLALRHGVRTELFEGGGAVRALETALPLFRETAGRDGFTPIPNAHYRAFLKNLDGSFLLLAYPPRMQKPISSVSSESSASSASLLNPIATLMGVAWNRTGYYYYGASSYAHRALMGPYLLQFEAMKLCKERGCTSYDLLGIDPPEKNQKPETRNRTTPHSWSGIGAFKAKFGGTVVEYPPEREVILRPVMRRLLQLKRTLTG